jgi:hypothetical protein
MGPKELLISKEGRAFSPDGIATIYYPGGHFDYGPLDLLLNAYPSAVVAIYADYWVEFDDLEKFIKSIRRRYETGRQVVVTELTPKDFGAKNIDAFYPKCWTDQQVQHYREENQTQLGFRYYFPEINLTLLYLKADAMQVYKSLQKVNIYPDIVVLQDHGYGGGWVDFGGESLLYKAAKSKPKYLYVAENTTAWPGYSQISDSHLDEGQMHHFLRSLYLKS